ncbi:MAG: putative metal-dependent hydrolase [Pelotomaculum thermopropionicum]|uniref:Putative metal-dependent hydrolase n=1 Tax=Pelotomaculum thermopropionicum TaxID=110500 RepID=A0A117M481_9FIRM|nr:MAG: putative metal-dependent hydrolase [Pelotomaculum thermopropionicum]
MYALDSHAHCGLTLPLETLLPLWDYGNIDGGVLFSPVEEVYDRYNRKFTDNESYRKSREKVHNYLKSLISERIFAYWFVWNDFLPPGQGFSGIKWHRHSNEPEYLYESEKCARFIDYVCNLHLPVIIEEEFHHTLQLVDRINRQTVVIIPHFGGLNGGYARLKEAGLFENNMVYVDTALAGSREIIDFAADYGTDRILFGSDFPFGEPAYECYKLERIFSGKTLEKVLAQNLLHLLGRD